MAAPRFVKKAVAEVRNEGQINTFSAVADLDNDGRPDIIISGRNGKFVWLQNMGPDAVWKEHFIADAVNMECGGYTHDLDRDGWLDIIVGGDAASDEIWWWENPRRPGIPWKRRIIAKTGRTQFHDTLVGDVTGDGVLSLVFTNQHGAGGTAVCRVPLPDDPAVSPWPGLEVLGAGKSVPNPRTPWLKDGLQPEEGLAIGDVDGDGRPEIISGTHWYKHTGKRGRPWEEHRFAAGYMTTKVAVGDLDGDGRSEIVLSEGDPCVYGHPEGGKLAWFKAPSDPTRMWQEHVLEDGLMDAHSLRLADLCGNGRLDIFVAEIGTGETFARNPPELVVWENNGRAEFTRHVIDVGTGAHDATLVDMDGDGALDIVGKPLQGPERYNVHVWYNRPA